MSELTAGRYKARIATWAVGESSKKGTPYVAFTCDLDAKLVGGAEEPCDPLRRTVFRYITDGTIDNVVKDLKALGYDRAGFDELEPDHPNAFDFEGKEVTLELKYESYEGKEVERWELRLGGGGIEHKKIDRRGLSKLNSAFGSKLKAFARPQSAPAQPPAGSHPAGGNGSDDEIAF